MWDVTHTLIYITCVPPPQFRHSLRSDALYKKIYVCDIYDTQTDTDTQTSLHSFVTASEVMRPGSWRTKKKILSKFSKSAWESVKSPWHVRGSPPKKNYKNIIIDDRENPWKFRESQWKVRQKSDTHTHTHTHTHSHTLTHTRAKKYEICACAELGIAGGSW